LNAIRIVHPAFGLLIAYLAGSLPTAYIAGRSLKGIDLRTVGSGNLGATNVYRNLGALPAIAVLLIDALKGALPVYFLPRLFGVGIPESDSALGWGLAYGLAAIAGHAKPIFLLWKGGGKGVATASGVFAVLAPGPLLVTTAACVVTVWSTGYMSLGSVVAAVLFPVCVYIAAGASPVFWVGVAVALFIVWSHRANLRRLRQGTETRLFPSRGTRR
jgi:glycerol-3-phosphate acyltransferase PlsY